MDVTFIYENHSHCSDGITNGAKWYDVPGGMEDFNYLHSNCFEITMELSCCKYPARADLPTEWNNNKEAMLRYMEAVRAGVKGTVKDEAGNPIRGATITINEIDHKERTTEQGEYWRLLTEGAYTMVVSAQGYPSSPAYAVNITAEEPLVNIDVVLNMSQVEFFLRLIGTYFLYLFGFYSFSSCCFDEYFLCSYFFFINEGLRSRIMEISYLNIGLRF